MTLHPAGEGSTSVFVPKPISPLLLVVDMTLLTPPRGPVPTDASRLSDGEQR